MEMQQQQPDPAVTFTFLQWLTRRWPELETPCGLELRALDPDAAHRNKHAQFTPDRLDEAASWAQDMAARDLNLYTVVNPIAPYLGRPCRDSDVLGAFFHFADADDPRAAENLKAWRRDQIGPVWSAAVITGTIPTTRVHVYWELTEPQRDLEAWRRTQIAIARRFASDGAVINPSRIMRLPGCATAPGEKKRALGYVSEVATLRRVEAPTVDAERLGRVFDTQPASAPQSGAESGFSFDTGEHQRGDLEDALRRCAIDGQKHGGVRDASAMLAARGADRVAIEFIIRKACPVWDANVENLIDTAISKYAVKPQSYTPDENRPERESSFFPASNFEGVIVPAREWHVPDLIPANQVTMLGGDGGTGKSLLLQQLAVSTALGRSWIGQDVNKPGCAILISAEDDRDELHRRLADISEAEGAAFSELSNLIVRSLAGEDALLATLDRKSNTLVTTPLFAELDECMGDLKPKLLGLDTLSDLHSGEENSRAHARQFIGMIRGLAIRHSCAVVLLAHPSLTGISSGSGLSGSTAWNNSVRSRLYLERIKDEDGQEPNPDARILSGKKANYARAGAEILMTWRDGVFVSDSPRPVSGLDRMAASAKAERVFLKLLREFTAQGRYVSASPSVTYAPKVFASSPDAEGCTKRALVAAMESLFSKGAIKVATHGSGAKARSHIVHSLET